MGETRHIAHETAPWVAVCTDFDYCWVGDEIIGFDSYAIIDHKAPASPNVKAQGKPVYRVGDMHHGVKADAGSHVRAGTSLDSGYVKFLTGQNNVKVNGIPVVRHGSECLVNCNAAGEGGAKGKVITAEKAPPSASSEPAKPSGLQLLWNATKTLPGGIQQGAISVAQGIKNAFTTGYDALTNNPQGAGFGAGLQAGLNEIGGEQAGTLEGIGNIFGGSSTDDFPVGTFPAPPALDPNVTGQPGYQGGKDAAALAAAAANVIVAKKMLGAEEGVFVRPKSVKLTKEQYKKWLEENGYNKDGKINSHIDSANASKPVELTSFKEGDEFSMYVRDGGSPGMYATEEGVSPSELAIDPSGRHLEVFKVNQPFEAVKSTVADFTEGQISGVGGTGGGVQFQLPANWQNMASRVK